MRKKCLGDLLLYSCAVSIRDLFRWLQDQACFEAETGLGRTRKYLAVRRRADDRCCRGGAGRRVLPGKESAAHQLSGLASRGVRGVKACARGRRCPAWRDGLALGGLWLLLSSGALSEPGLQRVLAVLAVVTGVVFARQMLAPGERENDAGALVGVSMPMVLLVFWLIVSYKVNIINPTISAYAVEILALWRRTDRVL